LTRYARSEFRRSRINSGRLMPEHSSSTATKGSQKEVENLVKRPESVNLLWANLPTFTMKRKKRKLKAGILAPKWRRNTTELLPKQSKVPRSL